MSGPIETGDVQRMQEMIDAIPMQDHDDLNFLLCLDSKGGSLAEGLALGEIVHKQFMGTYVPRGAECLSACAVIFMHGRVSYWETFVDFRVLHPGGVLGFHAPSLGLKMSPTDEVPGALVNAAYTAAMQNVSKLVENAATTVSATSRPIIPLSLLKDMLATPSDSFVYADTLHKTFRWQIDIMPHDLSAPEGFDLKVGYTQMCENMSYVLHPQTAPLDAPTQVTAKDVEFYETTYHATQPDVPKGHSLVKMGEMFEEQCTFVYNKKGDYFEVTYYVEGRPQGLRYLDSVFLFAPSTSLREIAGK
ncbi:hypothetical protein [Planktotalea sp.]|uniref:COG3904 family protein n=1 Tax=Planktotalea sp. TaxID=2029877 RepID=UPI003D6A1A2A